MSYLVPFPTYGGLLVKFSLSTDGGSASVRINIWTRRKKSNRYAPDRYLL